jgi:hypothetical protein
VLFAGCRGAGASDAMLREGCSQRWRQREG